MKTVTLLRSCVAQECGMGMIAKDCEEHCPACMVWLACLRTHVCDLLLCFVCWCKNKRKERRRFSSFLPAVTCASCRPARESQVPEQESGMDVRRALCVIAKDLLTLTPRWVGVALPRASSVNQTKIEFPGAQTACMLIGSNDLIDCNLTKLMSVSLCRIRFVP